MKMTVDLGNIGAVLDELQSMKSRLPKNTKTIAVIRPDFVFFFSCVKNIRLPCVRVTRAAARNTSIVPLDCEQKMKSARI